MPSSPSSSSSSSSEQQQIKPNSKSSNSMSDYEEEEEEDDANNEDGDGGESEDEKEGTKNYKSKRKLEDIDMNLNKNELGRSKRPKLWGEKDELRLLEGLIEFQSDHGKDGLVYRTEFFKFVVGSIKANVSRKQLVDKVLLLKRKFDKKMSKRIEDGKYPEISNPHEYKLFLLSKKIPGFQSNDSDVELSGENEEEGDLGKVYPFLMNAISSEPMSGIVSQCGGENNLKLVGGVKLKELNREWKEVSVMETELCLKRIGLLRKQMKLVVDKINSSLS